jgi:hypothetical protein
MEILYRQTPEMSLQSDYQSALEELCCEILRWFVHAFSFAGPFTIEKGFDIYCTIWTMVKRRDKACQKFSITVDVPDDNHESDEDIEDNSVEVIEG